ncbi:c-type cytochrome [Pendulispora brunnea]|uniref:C-type cytochrome n=1 Tax=Pendulispora brunnea TaxID=2905690 RepID=A0ABZ2K9L9_9BACT
MTPRWLLAPCMALALIAACEREKRPFQEPAPLSAAAAGYPSSSRAWGMRNAWGIAEGQRLYAQMNCAGCHAHGGGGMGPVLMDGKWAYGSEPATIFESIIAGRANGMPSFRSRLTDAQVWQLVAYVRSLSGLAPNDAAPGRDDHMSTRPPPSRTDPPANPEENP